MIEILATTLAAIMVPAIPFNTAIEFKQYVEHEHTQLEQVLENDSTAFASGQKTTIKTPNGTNVEALIYPEYFSDEAMNFYTNYFKWYPEYKLRPTTDDGATTTYNSFAYAFYMHWTDNPVRCWLADLNPFINDKSFIEVDTPQENDIILYYNDYYDDGVYKLDPIHAGIVKEVYNTESNGVCGNANTVEVISKWGEFGRYIHRGDECPYVSKYVFKDYENEIYFDIYATKVKYYRRHTSHSYTTKVEGSIHTYACKCGDTVEKHSYTKRYVNNGLNHTAYCECGEGKTSFHSYWNRYEKYNMTQHLSLIHI